MKIPPPGTPYEELEAFQKAFARPFIHGFDSAEIEDPMNDRDDPWMGDPCDPRAVECVRKIEGQERKQRSYACEEI